MNLKDFHDNLMEYRHRIETIPDALAQAITTDADEILSLRKDEILLGRNSDGDPFTPSYLDDPWFNTEEGKRRWGSAYNYSNYKNRMSIIYDDRIGHVLGYPNKDPDTPNLRITLKRWSPGENFQDSMFINSGKESFEIGSTYGDADAIDSKYDNKVYPPGPEAKTYFWKWILFPALYNHLWK